MTTSPDQTTRALERDRDPETMGELLRRRIRSGEVLERHVRLAAWLGYPPALTAAEPGCPACLRPNCQYCLRSPTPVFDVCFEVNFAAAWREYDLGSEESSRLSVAEVLCWGPPS